MKMDMVNPIPASNPKPKTCFQFALDSSVAIPNLTATHEKRVTPKGLPITNPKIIPNPRGLVIPSNFRFSNLIFVLARAKMGMIRKFTGLIIKCSKFSRGEVLFIGFEAIVKASKTPAIVA